MKKNMNRIVVGMLAGMILFASGCGESATEPVTELPASSGPEPTASDFPAIPKPQSPSLDPPMESEALVVIERHRGDLVLEATAGYGHGYGHGNGYGDGDGHGNGSGYGRG
jgi:hypothetical protein